MLAEGSDMPKNIHSKKIYRACINGFLNANKNYEKWTGGWSARHAPESLTQVEIARELIRIGIPSVTLEDLVIDIIWDAQGEKRGRIPRNSLGRIDITGWHKSNEPRFVIEVKRTNRISTIESDVKRLLKVVNRCKKLSKGILVVLTSAKTQKTIEKRLVNFAEENDIVLVEKSEFIASKNKSDINVYICCGVYVVT